MANNEAKAVISLDASAFEAGAKAAINASQAMAGVMKNAMSTAAGVIGGAAVIGGIQKLAAGIQSLTAGGITLATQMADLAATTGMSAEAATKYNFALQNGLSTAAASALMGQAAKNIGSTAETFRDLKIRLEAIWLNIQGVFTKIASFFAPVIDQILDMVEKVDWDAWVKSAKEFIIPLRNGIMAVIQLASEGKFWSLAGEVMQLGFMQAKNVLIYGFEVAQKLAAGLGDILKAAFKGLGNTVIWLGSLLGNIFASVFKDSGSLLGTAIYSGLVLIGTKINSFLVNLFTYPVATFMALLTKGIAELVDLIPESLRPEGLKNFKAPSLDAIMDTAFDIADGISTSFTKGSAEAGAEAAANFKAAAGQLTANIATAAKETGPLEDTLGAGEDLKKAMDAFKTALGTKFTDQTGAGAKQEKITAILKDAFARIKDTQQADTTNIKKIKPVFGEVDSLSSVGGGGGVGTGLTGVLDESRRQTRLQEQMVALLAPPGSPTGPSSGNAKLSFGF